MTGGQQCPVCSMVSTDSGITVSYHGKSYCFCSQQCQENFNNRPKLYLGDRAEKHQRKSVVKKRTFKLGIPISDIQGHSLQIALSAMMGVRKVQVVNGKVSITYDLLEATAEQIEKELVQAGSELETGWSTRLKRGWINYTEENELDNLATGDSACCNKPPAKG